MAKSKVVFRCGTCAYVSPKWMGRCSECGAWNSLIEEVQHAEPEGANRARTFRLPGEKDSLDSRPVLLSDVRADAAERRRTAIAELDRVLGGGLVPGSLVLVGGDPGIGKSTLLLQALSSLSTEQQKALYVTGEESPQQVKMRAERLGIQDERLFLFAETRVDKIAAAIETMRPAAVVIDSIQTVFEPSVQSAPGSVAQIRECAARLMYLTKSLLVPMFLVGHVTKHGELAGPRVLEHMVDTVLYFEQSGGQPYRILRAHKNRFGSTNEIGVFEMRSTGLDAVANPSELFLAQRPVEAPGSVVLPAIEGTRPVLVEVQALVSPTGFATPRRTCLGFEGNRAALLVAVLERSAGLELLSSDVFVNVAGGLVIDDPAADLAVALALASSFKKVPIREKTVVFGEVGLAGELRAVVQAPSRLHEAKKLGFLRAVLPKASMKKLEAPPDIELIFAATLDEAVEATLS